jgi:hypothetical protein
LIQTEQFIPLPGSTFCSWFNYCFTGTVKPDQANFAYQRHWQPLAVCSQKHGQIYTIVIAFIRQMACRFIARRFRTATACQDQDDVYTS